MKVTKKLERISIYDMTGPILDSLEAYQDRINRLIKEYPEYKLFVDISYDEDCNTSPLQIYGEREENEAEKTKRLKEELARKEYRRKQFEELKKEFEG